MCPTHSKATQCPGRKTTRQVRGAVDCGDGTVQLLGPRASNAASSSRTTQPSPLVHRKGLVATITRHTEGFERIRSVEGEHVRRKIVKRVAGASAQVVELAIDGCALQAIRVVRAPRPRFGFSGASAR